MAKGPRLRPRGARWPRAGLAAAALLGLGACEFRKPPEPLPGNKPPVAQADVFQTVIETPVEIDPLANDSDPDGHEIFLLTWSDPEGGTLEPAGDDRLRFTPDEGYLGLTDFEYLISDEHGAVATGVAAIDVVTHPLGLPRLEIFPEDPTLYCDGPPAPFVVLRHGVDDSFLDVTAEASWRVHDPTLATADTSGVVRWAGGDGLTYLSAEYSGLTSTVPLWVEGELPRGSPYMAGMGIFPKHPVAADIDGDGDLDLLATGYGQPAFSLRRNLGGRVFSGAQVYGLPADATELAVVDLDKDGTQDLVVGFRGGIRSYRGNGDGSFAVWRTLGYGGDTNSLTVGDFDGDGFPDVAAGAFYAATIYVSWNDGEGGLETLDLLGVGNQVKGVASGDWDGDGVDDLGYVNYFGMGTMLGSPARSFGTWRYFRGSPGLHSGIATGEFDGDGIPDIAASDDNAGAVQIYHGRGDGHFTSRQILYSGQRGVAVDVGELDGRPGDEVAVSNLLSRTTAVFSPGAGGSFEAVGRRYGPGTPLGVAFGDVDGNGLLDLVIGDRSRALMVHWDVQQADAPASRSYYAPDYGSGSPRPQNLAPADLNGDGIMDVVVHRSALSDLVGFLGKGDGTLDQAGRKVASLPALRYLRNVSAADIDGDGYADATTSGTRGFQFHRGVGNGSFYPPQALHAGVGNGPMRPIRLPGGGWGILHHAFDRWLRLAHDTGAGVVATPFVRTAGNARQLATGDLDGDGFEDIVAITGNVEFFLSDGALDWVASGSLGLSGVVDASVADVDGDEVADVLTFHGDGTVQVWRQAAGGGFSVSWRDKVSVYGGPSAASFGHFNCDASPDILVAFPGASTARVFLGRGDGTFSVRPPDIPLHADGGDFNNVVLADMNDDGRHDLLTTAAFNSDSFQVLVSP